MHPADFQARQQAIEIQGSYAVAAPAGSGKTGLLTQRVLKLLAVVDYPEEILCLTFTRKAAAEMRSRILSALQTAAQNDSEKSVNNDDYQQQNLAFAKQALSNDQQKGWQLLKSPNRLRIQTIDSFCRNLSNQLSQQSGLSDTLEPLEITTPFYQQAIREGLLSDIEKSGPLGEAIRSVLAHLDNDLNKLERLLVSLLQRRDQWLGLLLNIGNARQHLESTLKALIDTTLDKAARQLQPIASELTLLADYAASNLEARNSQSAITACKGLFALPEASHQQLPQWQALSSLLLTTANHADWRKEGGVNIKLGFPTAKDDPEFGEIRKKQFKQVLAWCREQPDLKEQLLDIRYLPPSHYQENQWAILDALVTLLPSITARLSLLFQEKSRCDFTEIAFAALQALGTDDQPTDLALKLDYQLKHILVDEFQDTSSLQYELLRRLTRGWIPNDGHSLFIVGDGMQSLYGFRSANVGLFLQARQHGIGDLPLTALDLTSNFRSQATIISWVNQVFRDIFPSQHNINRGAVSYSDAQAVKPSVAGDPLTLDMFVDYPDQDAARQAEAQHVVELVNQAKARDSKGSIAILVRNRSHLEATLTALSSAGHSWQAQDIAPLDKQMSVVDLMSLTRALCFPSDRIAWLAILRAPWCGLDLKDLHGLATFIKTDTIQSGTLQHEPLQPEIFQPEAFQTKTHQPDSLQPKNGQPDTIQPDKRHKSHHYPLLLSQLADSAENSLLSESGKSILKRVAPLLLQAWEQRRRKSLRIAIEGLWLNLGGHYSLENQYNLNSCIDFLNLIEKYEYGGHIADWQSFSLASEKLYAAPKDNSDPAIHVMTIHKAKGLEFDTVIMPGLNRPGASDSSELLLWREGVAEDGEAQLFIGPITQAGIEHDALYQHLKRERSLKSQLENARVFYVGVTRAVKYLHLSFCKESDKPAAPNSLLHCLWPWLEQQQDDSTVRINTHQGDALPAIQQQPASNNPLLENTWLKRLPVNWQNEDKKITQPSPTLADLDTSSYSANVSEALLAHQQVVPQQRHTGVVLHRILESLVKHDVLRSIDKPTAMHQLSQQQPFWRQQLRQLGVTNLDEATETLTRAVSRLYQDNSNHWIFDPHHIDSHCELSLGYRNQHDSFKVAIIDRTFIHQGKRWIIDYKLSEPSGNQSLDDFFYEQEQHYRSQLQHYAKLMTAKDLANFGEPKPITAALYFPLVAKLHLLTINI